MTGLGRHGSLHQDVVRARQKIGLGDQFDAQRRRDIHRQERSEWAIMNDRHVEKFSQVIEKNTEALSSIRIELNQAKCKA